MTVRAAIRWRVLAALLLALSWSFPASAQVEGDIDVGPPTDISALMGKPVSAIRVEVLGNLWAEKITLTRVHPGEPLTRELGRRAMAELLGSRKVADVRAWAEREGDGVSLVLEILPRRLVANVHISGSPLDAEAVLGAFGLRAGDEVTEPILNRRAEAVETLHAKAGYPDARVTIAAEDTDDPLQVLLRVRVDAGQSLRVAKRSFEVWPLPADPALGPQLRQYDVEVGAVQNEKALSDADDALEKRLRSLGWYEAQVTHRARAPGDLVVRVQAGPLIHVAFEGNDHFDQVALDEALDLDGREDHKLEVLEAVLRRFYVARGFLDVEVHAHRRGAPDAPRNDLVFRIRERAPVRVVRRVFPCLGTAKSPDELGLEIDGVLSEELPGAQVLDPVDPVLLDGVIGPPGSAARQVSPYRLNPWQTYSDEAYARVMVHLEELLRADGYLDARVGPLTVVRRRCDPRSGPDQCIVHGRRPIPRIDCAKEPADDAFDEEIRHTCEADPSKGVRCERDAVLVVPIRPGRQAILYDVAFEGNAALTEAELLEEADLPVGEALSTVDLEEARSRILDRYAEEAYAFAAVETELELSPDHTRARVRFSVSEGEPVRISRIVVQGARRTHESLIRSRFAIAEGELYRRSAVQRTQRQIETLGTFTSVAVGLEDPGVPAREKVLLVTVSERLPQYVDVKGGFSTGEGFRIGFEYGHRNIGGNAIQLVASAQLGLRPPFLIFEDDVRRKFEELSDDEGLAALLERRNTVTVSFPDVGLGPLFRLNVEGLDVRDNARDFGLTRDALTLRLIHTPYRDLWLQLAVSLELNDAEIFGTDERNALERFVQDNPRFSNTLRVPEGTSVAVAQSVGLTWDRRDQALEARRGTFVNVGIEHVTARPVDELETDCNTLLDEGVFAPSCSELLRYTNRIAGYLPLSEDGPSLAASFRWGLIQQLAGYSRTYPDRLFFLGGADSIRSYLQDSLVPQDIADRLLDENSGLSIDAVVLRGGDVFINPRLEARFPLSGSLRTALFIDAGNLWAEVKNFDPTVLRYAVGTGLRVATPVGPLVFDYGFNVERVIDFLSGGRENERYWEDIGAFHFSIGLF